MTSQVRAEIMAKILACSANGYGTGLMMKMTLDKVIDVCGFKVEKTGNDSIMEGRKRASCRYVCRCSLKRHESDRPPECYGTT